MTSQESKLILLSNQSVRRLYGTAPLSVPGLEHAPAKFKHLYNDDDDENDENVSKFKKSKRRSKMTDADMIHLGQVAAFRADPTKSGAMTEHVAKIVSSRQVARLVPSEFLLQMSPTANSDWTGDTSLSWAWLRYVSSTVPVEHRRTLYVPKQPLNLCLRSDTLRFTADSAPRARFRKAFVYASKQGCRFMPVLMHICDAKRRVEHAQLIFVCIPCMTGSQDKKQATVTPKITYFDPCGVRHQHPTYWSKVHTAVLHFMHKRLGVPDKIVLDYEALDLGDSPLIDAVRRADPVDLQRMVHISQYGQQQFWCLLVCHLVVLHATESLQTAADWLRAMTPEEAAVVMQAYVSGIMHHFDRVDTSPVHYHLQNIHPLLYPRQLSSLLDKRLKALATVTAASAAAAAAEADATTVDATSCVTCNRNVLSSEELEQRGMLQLTVYDRKQKHLAVVQFEKAASEAIKVDDAAAYMLGLDQLPPKTVLLMMGKLPVSGMGLSVLQLGRVRDKTIALELVPLPPTMSQAEMILEHLREAARSTVGKLAAAQKTETGVDASYTCKAQDLDALLYLLVMACGRHSIGLIASDTIVSGSTAAASAVTVPEIMLLLAGRVQVAECKALQQLQQTVLPELEWVAPILVSRVWRNQVKLLDPAKIASKSIAEMGVDRLLYIGVLGKDPAVTGVDRVTSIMVSPRGNLYI